MKLIKSLISLMLLSALVFSLENYNGMNDTLSITDTLEEDTLRYTTAVLLSEGEDIRVIVKTSDTTEVGFGDDSLEFFYGYQTGCPCWSSADVRDTCWDVRIVLDTIASANLGSMPVGKVDSTGALFRSKSQLDTLLVAGYAVQSRWFVPEWDCLIRFWAQGIADNNPVPNIIQFDVKRRTYTATRRK